MSEIEELNEKRESLSKNWKNIREKIKYSEDFIDGIILGLIGGIFAQLLIDLFTELFNAFGKTYSIGLRLGILLITGFAVYKIAKFHEKRLRKLRESEKLAAKQHNEVERDLANAKIK